MIQLVWVHRFVGKRVLFTDLFVLKRTVLDDQSQR